MKNIKEYIQENIFKYPQQINNINENYNILKCYFDEDNIPKFCNELLKQNYTASYIINEYLKSVSTKKTIEIIQKELSEYINTIEDENNLIFITFNNYNKIDKEKFNNILNTYRYIIHTRIGNKVILEPLSENNCNDYIYKDCKGIVFHLTDNITAEKILDVGLRPKIAQHETKRNLKDKQNANIDYKGKIYVLAIKDLSNIKNRIKEVKDKIFNKPTEIKVLKINLPKNIDFYKDNAMYDDMSYFTYVPIDSKYIELTNY